MESLVDQARRLVAFGVKELILVAQETTIYGVDLYGKRVFPNFYTNFAGLKGFIGSGFYTAIRRKLRMN